MIGAEGGTAPQAVWMPGVEWAGGERADGACTAAHCADPDPSAELTASSAILLSESVSAQDPISEDPSGDTPFQGFCTIGVAGTPIAAAGKPMAGEGMPMAAPAPTEPCDVPLITDGEPAALEKGDCKREAGTERVLGSSLGSGCLRSREGSAARGTPALTALPSTPSHRLPPDSGPATASGTTGGQSGGGRGSAPSIIEIMLWVISIGD